MEEIKLLVTEKKESISERILTKSICWKPWFFRNLNHTWKLLLPIRKLQFQIKAYSWDPDGRNQACSYGEEFVNIWKKSNFKEYVGNFGFYGVWTKRQKWSFPIETSSSTSEFSSETLMEEIKTLVTGKHEFEERED